MRECLKSGLALTVGLLLWGSAIAMAETEQIEVTILLTNDIYNVEYDLNEPRGGFARLAAVVKEERDEHDNVIFAHAGDTYSPSLLSGFDKGEHIVALTNLLAPDIFVPGNHEFDFGPEIFRTRVAASEFPVLAANLRNANGSKVGGVQDAVILTRDKIKFGIIGLTADNSPVKSSPGNLQFSNAVTRGVAAANELREAGADIIIAVTHSPRSQDQELFATGAFDIILSGDDHDLMLFYDGSTLMAESGEEAETVTAIDLTIELEQDEDRRRVSWHPRFRLIDTADVEPDPSMLKNVSNYADQLSSELDITIGTTTTELDSRRAKVRGEETAIGNLIADAMRRSVDADVALMNGGGIRGNKQYPADSELTRRDILSELPFGNNVVKLQLTGAQLLQALENGYSQVEDAAGRYAQVSGMTLDVDYSKPAGQRVSAVKINGAALVTSQRYTLATNNYLAGGGDGYSSLTEAETLLGNLDGKLLANTVITYISELGKVAPEIENRITVR